jgi:hypothetical protein
MATEKLKFRLELYATMWDKAPHAEVLIGDNSYFSADITGTEDNPNLIEFEHEFEEGKSYELIIKRSGKIEIKQLSMIMETSLKINFYTSRV